MFSKFFISLFIINLIGQSSTFSIVAQSNEFSKSDELNQASNISLETVQQVLLRKRSTRSARSESKMLNSIKGERIIKYDTECGIRSMYLRIDELGWKNKVLAPFGLTFNYCEGKCRPIEFTPLPLIVRDEDSTKLKIYENLLISKCG